jgi:hypothetical protein
MSRKTSSNILEKNKILKPILERPGANIPEKPTGSRPIEKQI